MDIRPFLVDSAVDETLQIGRATTLVDCGAVERIFDDVVAFDPLGRTRPGEQIVVGFIGMTGTDMAEGIDDPFVGQDTVCGRQFFENEIEFAHCAPLPCWPRSYGPHGAL